MTRSTSWAAVITAAALLAVPAAARAQDSPSPTAPPAEQTAAPAPPAESTEPQTPPARAAEPQPSQGDTSEVKQHLTAARDTLSRLTQLPAASQLTGDARVQVSQLITSFNELITTTTEWRASYAKVQNSLTSLIGEQQADESPAPQAEPAGAVGTSGTTALDPSIRAKLIEFRTHLRAFEQAAMAAGRPSEPAATATPAAPAAPSAGAAPAGTAPPAAAPDAPAPAATGTAGTGTPAPASGAAPNPADARQGHSEAERHIAAIEAILSSAGGGSGAASTPGAPGAAPTAGGAALDAAQIQQVRTHLEALRKGLQESRR